jgi:hypothetical protein
MFAALASSDSEHEQEVSPQPVASQVDHEVVDAQPISAADLLKMREAAPKAEPDFIPPVAAHESVIKKLAGEKVHVHVKIISGPLKGCRFNFFERPNKDILHIKNQLASITSLDYKSFLLFNDKREVLPHSMRVKDLSKKILRKHLTRNLWVMMVCSTCMCV